MRRILRKKTLISSEEEGEETPVVLPKKLLLRKKKEKEKKGKVKEEVEEDVEDVKQVEESDFPRKLLRFKKKEPDEESPVVPMKILRFKKKEEPEGEPEEVPEEDSEDSKICDEEGCGNKKHGLFKVCKPCFLTRFREDRTFKWMPAATGFATVMRILRSIPDIIDSSKIREKHINSGASSHIPIVCLKCRHQWSPIISSLVSKGSKCPRCAGQIPYDIDFFRERMQVRPEINISGVEKEHINAGCDSRVPVTCVDCKHGWNPSIDNLVNARTGCPNCAMVIKYTLQIFLEKMRKRPDVNTSDVRKEHINNGAYSHVPVTCVKSGHSWSPTIHSLVNSTRGCPVCGERIPYDIHLFREKMRDRQSIDISKVEEKHINDGNESRVPVKCLDCGYRWNPSISGLVNDRSGCLNCSKVAPYDLEFFREKMQARPSIDISGVRKEHINDGCNSHVPVKCEKGHSWNPTITSIVNNARGCPTCSKRVRYTLEIFRMRMTARQDINISNVKEEHIKNCKSHVPVTCTKSGHSWNPTISDLVNRGYGCPSCKSKRGIEAISNYLNQKNIPFLLEKTFEGLRDKRPLRIDVYIPKMSGSSHPVCIEFDGNYPGSHFSFRDDEEEKNHIDAVRRDGIKNFYMEQNNIHLIRIPYTCFKKTSPEEMNDALNEAFAFLKGKRSAVFYCADENPYNDRDEKLLEMELEDI